MPQETSAPAEVTASTEAVDSLLEYPGNPRRGDVELIADSIRRNGVYKPLVVQLSTRRVLAGNHTLRALRKLGRDTTPVWWVDVDDETAKRIVLVDNRANDLAEYDDKALFAMLKDLDGGLAGTGYDEDAMQALLDNMADDLLGLDDEPGNDDDADEDPEAGTLLALADVTVGEPSHKVRAGERWRVGPHLLVIAKLGEPEEHARWAGDLEGRFFAPYPEPYLTVSTLAHTTKMLLVQPNRYLAGHLLDKHAAVYGADEIELLS